MCLLGSEQLRDWWVTEISPDSRSGRTQENFSYHNLSEDGVWGLCPCWLAQLLLDMCWGRPSWYTNVVMQSCSPDRQTESGENDTDQWQEILSCTPTDPLLQLHLTFNVSITFTNTIYQVGTKTYDMCLWGHFIYKPQLLSQIIPPKRSPTVLILNTNNSQKESSMLTTCLWETPL